MKDKKAYINENCINCGMCYDECPFNAICEAGDVSEVRENKDIYSSYEHYFVNKEKCVACGRCMSVCPIKNITFEE